MSREHDFEWISFVVLSHADTGRKLTLGKQESSQVKDRKLPGSELLTSSRDVTQENRTQESVSSTTSRVAGSVLSTEAIIGAVGPSDIQRPGAATVETTGMNVRRSIFRQIWEVSSTIKSFVYIF